MAYRQELGRILKDKKYDKIDAGLPDQALGLFVREELARKEALRPKKKKERTKKFEELFSA